ncbi:MAG TPA: molecular chaperone DnaJ [Acidimicrobiales bacterium]|nr:molecular chaperone DnaJ [Acidimicrobiales bacterium]
MAPQREWFEKDYYKVLGVSATATDKEITRAYRKLAKQYHPDANPGSEERFKEISAAYDVLGDADRRKEYDEVRRLGPLGGFATGNGRQGSPFGGSFRVDDLSDLLGGIFGRGNRGQRTSGPARGTDLEAELHLSFQEAVDGVTTSVNVVSDAACHACSGSGAAPGTQPTVCSACGGRGVTEDNQGLFSFSQPCPACGGRGVRVEKPCPTCRGTGVERRPRQIKVRIPTGVEDGQRIRLKARGTPGRNGGPPGDLYVTVRVEPHRLFGRRGQDLTLTVPVTFSEAALGADITVPTLDSTVKVRIPAGTRSGRTLRVRGRGVRTDKGAGDLLVSVEVVVPQHLSDDQRRAIEALAQLSPESPRAHLGV